MYIILNLLVPGIFGVIFYLTGILVISEISLSKVFGYYVFLSFPHWIWISVSGYFNASKKTTVGGFIGAHILLIFLGMLALSSQGYFNGYFQIFLFPIFVGCGAYLAGFINFGKKNA
jgi:hypothetical protein